MYSARPNDPSMNPSVRNPPVRRGSSFRPPGPFCVCVSGKNTALRAPTTNQKVMSCLQILQLPRKVTSQHHQTLRLPAKSLSWLIDPHRNWNVSHNARSNGRQPACSQRFPVPRSVPLVWKNIACRAPTTYRKVMSCLQILHLPR